MDFRSVGDLNMEDYYAFFPPCFLRFVCEVLLFFARGSHVIACDDISSLNIFFAICRRLRPKH